MDVDFFDTEDGARLRIARWPAASSPRASVILLPGRSEFHEKYDELGHTLAVRGYEVRALEWYGQGGSSRPLPQRQKGHVDSYERLLSHFYEWTDRCIGPEPSTRPLVLLGHSKGGHLALRALAERPNIADAAVLTAPMIDILPGAKRWAVRALSWGAVRLGQGRAFAFGEGPFDPMRRRFHRNRLTGHPGRFELTNRLFVERPELSLGGVTWGWLDASFRSMATARAKAYLGRITVPVLIAVAGRDRLVRNAAIRKAARRLPNATVKTYPDALHELLMERDEVRNTVLDDMDRFIDALGGTA